MEITVMNTYYWAIMIALGAGITYAAQNPITQFDNVLRLFNDKKILLSDIDKEIIKKSSFLLKYYSEKLAAEKLAAEKLAVEEPLSPARIVQKHLATKNISLDEETIQGLLVDLVTLMRGVHVSNLSAQEWLYMWVIVDYLGIDTENYIGQQLAAHVDIMLDTNAAHLIIVPLMLYYSNA